MGSPLTLEETAKLHGHKGPWLVAGYKAGLRALEVLGGSVECSVRLPLTTPYTCLIDGIQGSSGCTLGRMLIKVSEGPKYGITAVFKASDGRAVELKVKAEFVDYVERKLSELGVEEAGRAVEGWDCSRMFEERLYP